LCSVTIHVKKALPLVNVQERKSWMHWRFAVFFVTIMICPLEVLSNERERFPQNRNFSDRKNF
jgi:hypothetical protein